VLHPPVDARHRRSKGPQVTAVSPAAEPGSRPLLTSTWIEQWNIRSCKRGARQDWLPHPDTPRRAARKYLPLQLSTFIIYFSTPNRRRNCCSLIFACRKSKLSASRPLQDSRKLSDQNNEISPTPSVNCSLFKKDNGVVPEIRRPDGTILPSLKWHCPTQLQYSNDIQGVKRALGSPPTLLRLCRNFGRRLRDQQHPRSAIQVYILAVGRNRRHDRVIHSRCRQRQPMHSDHPAAVRT
jgi:hypothetical protein